MVEIKLTELECKKCKHKWTPRTEEVRQCPKCKSAWWDKYAQIGEVSESRIN